MEKSQTKVHSSIPDCVEVVVIGNFGWNGMELDRIDYYCVGGMGLTAVRASSSTIIIPPRFLHFESLRASSISSHYNNNHHAVYVHHNLDPLARISLLLCWPKLLLYAKQTSSASHIAFSVLSSSSPAPFHCGSYWFSSSSSSSSSSSLSPPAVSLMSSRLAPAYSSSCGLTRLESRSHRGPKWTGPGNVKASVEIRSNSVFGECWWKDGRVVGRGSSTRCMENQKNGQRIECYSSSSQAAPGGGGDQPMSSSTVLPPTIPSVSNVKGFAISFCPRCGGATEEKIPVGEHEKRYVCTACGAVHYQNPKMVVGCLVEHEGKILLCRRNIEPSYGLWTLPAGYMEMGESAAEGAARETLEEACAKVQVLGLFAHLDIPLIGQSHIYFRAQLKDPHFAPGPESIECALFKLNEIPFDSLAFSSIQVALKLYIEDTEAGKWRVHHGVIDKRPGAGPSDLKGFLVRDVLSS